MIDNGPNSLNYAFKLNKIITKILSTSLHSNVKENKNSSLTISKRRPEKDIENPRDKYIRFCCVI